MSARAGEREDTGQNEHWVLVPIRARVLTRALSNPHSQVRMERARLLGLAQSQQRRVEDYQRALQAARGALPRQPHSDLPSSLVPYARGAGPAAAAVAPGKTGEAAARVEGRPRRGSPSTPSPVHRLAPVHRIAEVLSHEERHLRNLFATSPLATAPPEAGRRRAWTSPDPASKDQALSPSSSTWRGAGGEEKEEERRGGSGEGRERAEAVELRERIALLDQLIEARMRGAEEAEKKEKADEEEDEAEGGRRAKRPVGKVPPSTGLPSLPSRPGPTSARFSPRRHATRRFRDTPSPRRGATLARSALETTSRGTASARADAMSRRLEVALERLARIEAGERVVEKEAARVVAPLEDAEGEGEGKEDEEEGSGWDAPSAQREAMRGVTALAARGSAALAVARQHVDQRRCMLLVCILQRLRGRRRDLNRALAAAEADAASKVRAAHQARADAREEAERLARERERAGRSCEAEGTRMCAESRRRVAARQERVEAQAELLRSQLQAVREEVDVLRAAASVNVTHNAASATEGGEADTSTGARSATTAPTGAPAGKSPPQEQQFARTGPSQWPTGRHTAPKGVPVGKRTVSVASLLNGAL